MGGGDRFGGLIEHDALDRVADIAAIEYVGNVGQRDHDEAASVSRERGFDALLHGEEWQRIIVVDAVGITHGDAHLSDATQALLNQALMPGMKRLIAPEEQSRRLLWIERRTEPSQHPLGPVLRRAFGGHANIKALRRNKHPVCIFEATGTDPVDPNCKRLTEGGACFFGRADEIGDHRAVCLDDAVANPAHSPRVLDAIPMAKAQIARDVATNCVGVEHNRVEKRPECVRERGLACAGQTHDENLAHQYTCPVAQQWASVEPARYSAASRYGHQFRMSPSQPLRRPARPRTANPMRRRALELLASWLRW